MVSFAAIAERTNAEPADLARAASATYAQPYENIGYEYVRVKARGRFHHDKERYFTRPISSAVPAIRS